VELLLAPPQLVFVPGTLFKA